MTSAPAPSVDSPWVPLSGADLDLAWSPVAGSRLAAIGNLTKRCQYVMGVVKEAFPDASAPAGCKWKTGDSKTAISKGGGEVAFERLLEKFRDRERPWYHGARARLGLPPDLPISRV